MKKMVLVFLGCYAMILVAGDNRQQVRDLNHEGLFRHEGNVRPEIGLIIEIPDAGGFNGRPVIRPVLLRRHNAMLPDQAEEFARGVVNARKEAP